MTDSMASPVGLVILNLNYMIEVKSNGKVDARELHKALGSKQRFADWIKRKVVNNSFFAENEDFNRCHKSMYAKTVQRSGIKTPIDYELTVDAAKKVALSEQTRSGNKIREYFISIEEAKQNFDTLTHDEVINLSKRIDAFKYEDNQKAIEKMHKEQFVKTGKGSFSDFNIKRNSILHTHTNKIDAAIKEFCIKNNQKLPNLKSKHDKIQFFDEHKNLKHAIWDSLEIQGNKHSSKLANLGERMAKALGIKTKKTNETNLFQLKENIDINAIFAGAKKINYRSKK